MTLSLTSLAAVTVIVVALGAAFSRRFIAWGALALANVGVYLLTAFGPKVVVETGTGAYLSPVIHQELALRGSLLANLEPMALLQLLTSMFVHADFFHLLGNLIVLLSFVLPFEERVGPRAIALIYLGTGLVGTLAHTATSWGDPGLLMGASGAVFGIIGAFAAAFPRLVLPLPLPLVIIMIWVRMRVIVAAAAFAAVQFLYLYWVSLDPSSPLSNTAYLAHLGGLVAGLAVGGGLSRSKVVRRTGRVAVDLGLLAPFATDAGSSRALDQMKSNEDEPAIFQAWLDRFFRTATCPTCSGHVMPHHQGHVVCQRGHRFDVRRGAPQPAAPAPSSP